MYWLGIRFPIPSSLSSWSVVNPYVTRNAVTTARGRVDRRLDGCEELGVREPIRHAVVAHDGHGLCKGMITIVNHNHNHALT